MIICKLKYLFSRNATPVMLIALSVLFTLVVSCGGGGGGVSSSSDSTSVTINLGQRERIAGALSIQAIPDSVESVVIKVTGAGMTPIVRTINIYDFTVLNELIQVPSGSDRLFEVVAYDETNGNGILLYKGDVSANLTGTPVSLNVIMQSTDYDNLLDQGFYELAEMQDILSAREFFKQAAALSGNSGSNQADTARFLYGLTRVFALFFEGESDGNAANGINTAGEIADLYDCVISDLSPANPDLFAAVCPQLMPDNSPTGGQLQGYLYNIVRPELIGAIESFNGISNAFNVNWYEPFGVTYVESDYGDVLAFRAAFKSMLSQILMQQAYNLNIDIDAQEGSGKTIQQFLSENPAFLSLTNPAHLLTAKSYLTGSALDDSVAAIDWMLAEIDDQTNDLINIDIGPNPGQITLDEINKAKEHIALAKICLNGQCTLDDNETPADTSDDTVMDFSRLYSGAVNFRSLMPAFIGDFSQGFLPDPTFGGMLVRSHGYLPSVLNEDLNSNGLADIFENDLYYVYGGNVLPPNPYSWDFLGNPEASGYILLGVANSSDGVGNFTGPYDYYLIQNFRNRGFIDDDYDVNIDSIEFFSGTESQGVCCEGNVWSSLESGFMRNWDFILMESPSSVDNIKVYTYSLP